MSYYVLTQNQTFEAFQSKYGDKLNNLPEDKWIGVNVTSLMSHMIITGKLYRILIKSKTNLLEEVEKEIWEDEHKIKQIISEKEELWKFCVALLQFDFHQNPFRAKDLSIFELRQETLDHIVHYFSDNIMMSFDNQNSTGL